ncbi:MAG: MMPL family transporter, partial [Deltaproteobacteria bacterium]|nr:MMPL family transporter [Deltaproteobacteria bacterium]
GLRVRAAGHPLVAAALDRESARVERVFAPLLIGLSIIGVAAFLRSGLLAFLAVLPAILASAGARAGLRLCGVDGDLILVSVGPIAFVVILASTLHLVSVFRMRYGAGASQLQAAHAARREKFATAMLAALTTAVGFGVFLLSDLRSVSQLGLTVAITVLIVVPLAFLGLTPPLAGIPMRRPRLRPAMRTRWRRLAEQSVRRRGWVVPLAVAVLIAGSYAAVGLPMETNALEYFPRGHTVREDFASIESEGGALSSAEVLVRGASSWDLDRAAFARIGSRLEAVAGLRGVFGPEAVLDEVRESAGIAAFALNRQALERAGRLDGDGEWARWTVRFPTVDDEHCRSILAAVTAAAAAAVDEAAPTGGEFLIAGSLPAVLEMQRHLVGTLSTSLVGTLIATTLLFLLAVRSVRELGIAVLVNLIPVAGVFLAARILGFALDGATVMVAAVVLGLAVDNTFHILHAARHRRDARARLRAFGRVADAAVISSLALALGFMTLALSGFAPTARFGILCSLGALCALASDLIVLPALWVRPRRMRS